ncbi:hypothetical protein LAT59_03610 [Candidatus Gracilibacteria bacterium]|nr:hypothetical protein [Candidatus Gracilibacteria bacterium]
MKLYNICLSLHPIFFTELTKNIPQDSLSGLYSKDSDETVTVFLSSISELEDFLSKHPVDSVLRFIYTGIGKLHISSHMKNGDILFPNTFLSQKTGEAIYVDYAVGEGYDLEKFILHLDGVCIDAFGEVSEEFDGDIEESKAYKTLSYISDNGLLEKSVVILGTEENEEHLERISAIIDMITSD